MCNSCVYKCNALLLLGYGRLTLAHRDLHREDAPYGHAGGGEQLGRRVQIALEYFDIFVRGE